MEEMLSVGGIAFIITLIGLSLGFLLIRVQAR